MNLVASSILLLASSLLSMYLSISHTRAAPSLPDVHNPPFAPPAL